MVARSRDQEFTRTRCEVCDCSLLNAQVQIQETCARRLGEELARQPDMYLLKLMYNASMDLRLRASPLACSYSYSICWAVAHRQSMSQSQITDGPARSLP